MDLALMRMGSRALGLLPGVQWLSLPEVVDEFEKLMVQQIDLRYEAQNLEQFQRNFRNVTSVKFPTPLRPFVTRDVLVETYEVRAWQLGLAGPCAHSQAIVARTVPVGEGA